MLLAVASPIPSIEHSIAKLAWLISAGKLNVTFVDDVFELVEAVVAEDFDALLFLLLRKRL